MAKSNNLTDFLTDVANAIRAKKGTTAKINPQDFSSEIASISTGGGDTPTPDTPTPPTPDMPVIGDGKTYLYIKIAEKGRMTVPLKFVQSVANGVTIDWGDGSATQTFSTPGNVDATHTYADVGEYTISLNPSSGTLGLKSGSSSYCVMGSTGDKGKVYCNMLQAVEVGKNVASIGNYAFYNCYSLASVVIPDSVKSIGDYAFQNCYSLTSIEIPDSVKSIGVYAFNGCYSLVSIEIPESVTSIRNYVFAGCYSLASIEIPQGVTSIGNYAFSYCSPLSSVVIPEGVTSIGTYAFIYCYSLTSIEIPDSVTSIGTNAFSGCYSLASVVIPESVTSIGNYAFNNCYGMAYYDFRASKSVPTLGGTSVFYNVPSDCKIVVPDALYDTWKAATYWSTHASKIVKASEFNG